MEEDKLLFVLKSEISCDSCFRNHVSFLEHVIGGLNVPWKELMWNESVEFLATRCGDM